MENTQVNWSELLTVIPEEVRNKMICQPDKCYIDLAQETLDEIIRQDEIYGNQDHVTPFEWMSILAEEVGELGEAINETFSSAIRHPERGGIELIRKEAIQVAAVALHMAIVSEYHLPK
jgi:NTP pyrophosphatase (non-canonical NTP hydrolase)